MALSIRVWQPQTHISVLRAEGRIDAESSPRFLDACRTCLDTGHLVLDLSAVTFLSSSGVGALLVLLESARERCRGVSIAPASPEVISVLEALNLGNELVVLESQDEAFAKLRAA